MRGPATCAPARRPRRTACGSALVVALALLLVCGLLAVAIVRVVLAQERGVRNLWQEGVASQYAEIALAFCETQLTLASPQRVAGLRDIESSVPVAPASGAWRQPGAWGGPSSRAVALPARDFLSQEGGLAPARSPDCLAERVTLGDGVAYLVTARGFSPGYRQDTAGAATAGAVVWLQSLLAAE